MSLLLEGKIMTMIFKIIQMMVHQAQNQMNHAKKENIKSRIYHPTFKHKLSP